MFGTGYAVAHPELVAALMQSASSDYAAQLVARPIEHVAEALVEEEEASGIMQRDRAERLGRLRCCCLTAWRNAFISVRGSNGEPAWTPPRRQRAGDYLGVDRRWQSQTTR